MMADAFIEAGCDGNTGHDQPYDRLQRGEHIEWPKAWPAVVRRSYPHGEDWPDLDQLRRDFRERFAAETVVIAIWRIFFAVCESKVRHGNVEQANVVAETARAYRLLEKQLADFNGEVVEVRYERFVRLEHERERLFASCGLSTPQLKLYDGNAKHRK